MATAQMGFHAQLKLNKLSDLILNEFQITVTQFA